MLNRPRAERLLAEAGVDGLLAGTLENVYYVSGVWSENFEVLPRAQLFALVAADALDRPRVISGVDEAANIHDAGPTSTTSTTRARSSDISMGRRARPDLLLRHAHVIGVANHASLIDAAVAAVADAGLHARRSPTMSAASLPRTLRLCERLADATLVPG